MPNHSSPKSPPPLDLDEWIAIIVAFTTIGGILYWALGKKDESWNLKNFRFLPPFPQPNSTSEPKQAPKPTPIAPESSSPQATSDPQTRERGKGDEIPLPSSLSLPPRQPKPRTSQKTPSLNRTSVKPTPTVPTPSVEFSDVGEQEWAREAIASLTQQDLVAGFPDRTFKPHQVATRGELAAILQNLVDKKNKHRAIAFKDLPANYWATAAIRDVSKTGALKGYPGEKFQPNQPVSRVEVLVALATALNLKTPSTPAKILQSYKDGDQVPDYALPKVAAAQTAGWVVGYQASSKLLNPTQHATRAEVAAMIYRALERSRKL
ncbi:MAG TPA: S-layer protein [Cyanobacteria bacterium UBA8803]|nr:S-layer protein [Cyanobacteria bacterium UBA8803]